MTILSAAQIAGLAKAAGFKGGALTIAVAVCLAESGGDTKAVNGLTAEGLWQINPLAHPDQNPNLLFDPAYNAAAAFKISGGGTTWQPWDAYTNGAYQGFLDQAEAASHAPVVFAPVHVTPTRQQQTSFLTPWPTSLTALQVNGEQLSADLRMSVKNATLEQRIDAASTVELEIADPAAVLINKALWTTKSVLVLDGLRYRLARVDRNEGVITSTFEDVLVATLRDAKGHIIAPAGSTTLPQFMYRLCAMSKVPAFVCTAELKGLGGARGDVVSKEAIERLAIGSDGIPAEDSWDCLARLAGELNWRRFSTGRAVWIGPDAWIRAHIAATIRIREHVDGIGRINFGVDVRETDGNEATFTLDGGAKWRPAIGQGVVMLELGPASKGAPWIVTDISRPRFSKRANITVGRAQRDTPTGASVSAKTDDGSITSAAQYGQTPKAVVSFAYDQLGKPYAWGEAGPDSYDCSGLTSQAYLHGAGKTIPRVSQLQWATLTHVSDALRQPGDIACFGDPNVVLEAQCTHVGIYIGDDSMVAADNHTVPVRIDTAISTWTDPQYLGCVRP